MKVLLINPGVSTDPPATFFPIGLAYVATVIHRAGHALTICDLEAHPRSPAELRAFLASERYDVVGVGALVTQYRWAKWIIALVREVMPSARIVVGNAVASSVPELLLGKTDADVLVVGEGEVTILDLLSRLERNEPLDVVPGIALRGKGGTIRFTPPRAPIEELDALPFIRRDLFDMEAYLRASPNVINEPLPRPAEEIRAITLNNARGCLYACTFCSARFLRAGYAARSPRSVVAEIKELQRAYGANFIQLTSTLAFASKRHLAEFCDHLLAEKVDVHWAASVSGTLFATDDPSNLGIAQRAKAAGCVFVAFSVESADPDIRRAMRRPETLEGYSRTRRTFRAAKIATLSSLVFGYPQETQETIDRTIDFCISEGLTPGAGFLQVLPGTAMYDHARAAGLIPDEEAYLLRMGAFHDLHINLTRMTDAQLTTAVFQGIQRGRRAVLGRVPDLPNPLRTPRYLSGDDL